MSNSQNPNIITTNNNMYHIFTLYHLVSTGTNKHFDIVITGVKTNG
jgi:hypothetical protein